MLLNFRVENFMSIKDPMELSFEASSIKSLQENIVQSGPNIPKDYKALKVTSIYGANASGKTNIIKAMATMKRIIVSSNSYNKGDSLPFMPFRLDEAYLDLPTAFEVDLVIDDIYYTYGFKYNEKRVINENLYYYPNGRKSIIFERGIVNSKDVSGRVYKFTVDKTKQEFLSSMTSENKLYLSVATNLEFDLTEKVFNWFKNKLIIWLEDDSSWKEYSAEMLSNEINKGQILNFLRGSDFNIYDIEAGNHKDSVDDYLLNSGEHAEVKTIKKGYNLAGEAVKVEFDLVEESHGTQKFFELAGQFIDILKNGYTLFYDELDTKLHSNLILFLIKLFNINASKAQLMFTTHNIVALDQRYLRRDQLYFMNMKRDNSSELYSLYDFPTEKNTSNVMRRYLTGRYNAVPFIDENYADDIFVEVLNGKEV